MMFLTSVMFPESLPEAGGTAFRAVNSPSFPSFRKQRWGVLYEAKASLVYTSSSRSARATGRPCLPHAKGGFMCMYSIRPSVHPSVTPTPLLFLPLCPYFSLMVRLSDVFLSEAILQSSGRSDTIALSHLQTTSVLLLQKYLFCKTVHALDFLLPVLTYLSVRSLGAGAVDVQPTFILGIKYISEQRAHLQ